MKCDNCQDKNGNYAPFRTIEGLEKFKQCQICQRFYCKECHKEILENFLTDHLGNCNENKIENFEEGNSNKFQFLNKIQKNPHAQTVEKKTL